MNKEIPKVVKSCLTHVRDLQLTTAPTHLSVAYLAFRLFYNISQVSLETTICPVQNSSLTLSNANKG